MIDSFSGEYSWLSNFWPIKVKFEDEIYPSVEHAYVAAKFEDPELRRAVRECATAGKAKRFGRKHEAKIVDNWSDRRLGVMIDLLRQKFADAELRQKLLATGDERLVEGNTWGDYYWGICDGKGRNLLGEVLMMIRSELSA